jgi:AraC-like DNA-binding protein
LNYAHRGTLRLQLDDGRRFVLKAPVSYWTWPGPTFRYQNVSPEPWEHYYVSFTGDRIREWDERGLFPTNTPRPFAHITNPDRFQALFEALLESLSHHPVENPEAVHLLEGILLQVHTQPRRQTLHHPRREQVQALMNRISESPERMYDLDGEAAGMGMTPAHLRRLFRLFAGCSPVAYVNRARMRRAAAVLRTTDTPIKKVAADAGFEDIYYFTKTFSRHHGLPPGRYRRAFQRMGD